jgi:hypothetical protein
MTAIPRTNDRSLLGRLLTLTLVAFMAVFALSACSEDSTGPSDEDREAAQVLADEGFDILTAALSADVPDFPTIESAKAKFEDAIELHPNNADANIGLALTEIILIGNDPTVLAAIGGGLGTGIFGKALPAGSGGFHKALAGPASSEQMLSTKGTLDWMRGTLARPVQEPIPDLTAIQNAVEQVIIPVMAAVTNALGVVESDPGWELLIVATVGTTSEFRLEIDLTDIYMLDAMVRAFKAQLHAFVAYTMDAPQSMTDTTAVKAALNQTDGTFLKIRANGVNNLNLARTELITAVGKMGNFKTSLLNEEADQSDDLIVLGGVDGPMSLQDLNEMEAELTSLLLSLNGSTAVTEDFDGNGTEETMDIDLSKLFTNPITDWKQAIPPYAWDSGNAMFFWAGYQVGDFTQFDWPNHTFNGLFPDITDSDDFNATFGITFFPSAGPFDDGSVG